MADDIRRLVVRNPSFSGAVSDTNCGYLLVWAQLLTFAMYKRHTLAIKMYTMYRLSGAR